MTDIKKRMGALRARIDTIDDTIIPLFAERMAAARELGQLKSGGNLAIRDPAREREVLERVDAACDENLRGEASLLMRTLMALSREYQHKTLFSSDTALLPPPRAAESGRIPCAYQGVPGAWSEQALLRLFPEAERIAVEYFEDVFTAVRERRVRYGVVAIENTQTGAIGETYDLLRKYGCYVVGKLWVGIRQCLLAPKGMTLEAVREVLSHPEGFKQCGRFLRGRAWDLTACRNTAVAAQTAAERNDGRTAAIGARLAASLHGLNVLMPDIMDSESNRTAFVVIAAEPEYDAQSDRISVTFSTEHRSGALCEALLPFMAQNVNLLRIESRPSAPGQYRFFADLGGNVEEAAAKAALRQAAAACEYFEVLGCYRETAE